MRAMRSLIEMHSLIPSSEGKRRSPEERMEWLGIEDYDYQRFEEMFLRPREKHHHILKTENSWVEIKHPWNKNQVLRHLTGEQTIGLFPASELDYLMVDIDRHNNENETQLKSRIKEVTEVIEGDPLIYLSSFSSGIRLCYFLEKPVAREELFHGFKNFFQQKNLTVEPGVVEILASRKGDRLPFGEGSYLVDSFNLEPIYHLTLKETIAIAFRVFQDQKIDVPFNIEILDPVLDPCPQDNSVFDLIVTRLYEEGLYPEITTNEALLKLSWDLIIRKGYSKEQTEKFLISWILQKHNGLSNRFNAGKVDAILSQIKRIVQGTNPILAKYPISRYAVREKKLSLSDVGKIILLTKDQKLQLAIFSLLEFCFCFGKEFKNRKREKNKISNIYGSQKGDVTYRSHIKADFYCEISKKTLQHLPGFGKREPQVTMRKIEGLGLLSLKRRAHPQSHHCRQFWVHFKFEENDPLKVVSLDEGLLLLQRLDKESKILEAKSFEKVHKT
jgi:hypothetical protein